MCVYFSIQTQTHTHKLFNFYNLFLNLTKKIKTKINNMRYIHTDSSMLLSIYSSTHCLPLSININQKKKNENYLIKKFRILNPKVNV